MRKIFIASLMLLSLILSSAKAKAQVERVKLIGAYCYNFARYTSWPEEARDSFRILLIADDRTIIKEFIEFSQEKKIKEMPISIRVGSFVPSPLPDDICMVFLSNEKSNLFYDLYHQIEERPVLLVTDNFVDKQNVLFNLYDTAENELLFEVNKANILNHHLKIDPEILLLGGTEIDVAELYRKSQKSIEKLQSKMKVMNDSLASMNKQVAQTFLQIKDQQKSMFEQNNMLKAQELELIAGREKINRRNAEIGNTQELIHQQKLLLAKQKKSIEEQLAELSGQQSFIDRQQDQIKKSKAVLDSLKSAIENKNTALGEQSTVIQRQKITVLLSVVIGVLSLIVLIVLILNHRSNIKKNKLLVQQKEKIEQINYKLHATNKSLYGTITRLNETQSQLVATEKMASLGVLTAGIAHEINNPVNFIYTGINSLKKDIEELLVLFESIDREIEKTGRPELIQAIDKIKHEGELDEIMEIIPQTIDDIKVGAERAADIIKGLRNFSRLDKDAMQVFDLHEGLNSALLLLRNKFKHHIEVEKDYRQLPKIECYPGKLNQAFLNILSNSIDAIAGKGKIIVRTRKEEDWVKIQIEDTGRGIPAESIDKIFDPFFTTKSVGKGIGLGLSITFGIIQDHDGKIEVKSELNSGTVFTISLPCSMEKD